MAALGFPLLREYLLTALPSSSIFVALAAGHMAVGLRLVYEVSRGLDNVSYMFRAVVVS